MITWYSSFGREDRRDLARAVGDGERDLDLIDGQAERRDLIAIERDGHLRIADLQVAE